MKLPWWIPLRWENTVEQKRRHWHLRFPVAQLSSFTFEVGLMKTQGKKASKSATQLEKQVGLQYNVNSRNGFLLTIIITYPVVDPEGPILQPREQNNYYGQNCPNVCDNFVKKLTVVSEIRNSRQLQRDEVSLIFMAQTYIHAHHVVWIFQIYAVIVLRN